MKFEIDTILYIVISIIIIAASTLGKKKRKPVQQAPQQPQAEEGEETADFPFGPFSNVKTMFESVSEPGAPGLMDEYAREDRPEQVVDEEEGIIDEEEMILNERMMTREEEQMARKEERALKQEQFLEEKLSSAGEKGGEEIPQEADEIRDDGFFRDSSEIRRAIIYFEILKRPEY